MSQQKQSYDLSKLVARTFDGYVVLWSVQDKKWMKLHVVDGKDGLSSGNFTLNDPAGSRPPDELLQSCFRDKRTEQRIHAAYNV
jgi:hypothetical protein